MTNRKCKLLVLMITWNHFTAFFWARKICIEWKREPGQVGLRRHGEKSGSMGEKGGLGEGKEEGKGSILGVWEEVKE